MSELQSHWILPGAPLWDEVLAQTQYDFYHLPGYLHLCALQEGGQPSAFYVQEGQRRFFLPLIMRSIPGLGNQIGYDVTSPYGYAGPLVYSCGADDEVEEPTDIDDEAASEWDAFVTRSVLRLRTELADCGVVSAFFRLHPLLSRHTSALCVAGEVVPNGDTVYIDLGLSEEEIWKQTRSGHRSEINQSLRRGFQVSMYALDSPDELDVPLRTFSQFYSQTMQRLNAADSYRYDYAYFLALKQMLGERLFLAEVSIDAEPACSALFVETNGIVQYHLSGVGEKYVQAHPTKMMLHQVCKWARERGNRYLHLGGGLGGRADSLFTFKTGFSRTTTPFQTWRMIVNPARYASLVVEWEARTGHAASTMDTYFPAYRKVIEDKSMELNSESVNAESVPLDKMSATQVTLHEMNGSTP